MCGVVIFVIFFFFKQKTAYEMRISDWSSDVCSSDLVLPAVHEVPRRGTGSRSQGAGRGRAAHDQREDRARVPQAAGVLQRRVPAAGACRHRDHRPAGRGGLLRSEEHTSELQSLMRTSYAVFCLKKKRMQYTTRKIKKIHHRL